MRLDRDERSFLQIIAMLAQSGAQSSPGASIHQ
jgi:hypothetical protein